MEETKREKDEEDRSADSALIARFSWERDNDENNDDGLK